MTNLYVIRDQQTGYTGCISGADSDGSFIANIGQTLAACNHENPLVISMIANSAIYCVGGFDADTLELIPCQARLVTNLCNVPIPDIGGVVDEKSDEQDNPAI